MAPAARSFLKSVSPLVVHVLGAWERVPMGCPKTDSSSTTADRLQLTGFDLSSDPGCEVAAQSKWSGV